MSGANQFRGRGPDRDVLDATIAIERAFTNDDSNGPWPPDGDGWRLVQRFNGRSLWRRLSLNNRSDHIDARVLRERD